MRVRIGMVLGPYWGSIVNTLDVIAAISALGTIGGMSALLHAATPYARHTMRWWRGTLNRVAAEKSPTADGLSHRQ